MSNSSKFFIFKWGIPLRASRLIWIVVLLLLTSCAGPLAAEPDVEAALIVEPPRPPSPEPLPPQTAEPENTPEEQLQTELDGLFWLAAAAHHPFEVIEAYFEIQYLSYIHNHQVDFSPILDINQFGTYNIDRWMAGLVQRRRLIEENSLCYVNTEKYDYTINLIEEEDLNDVRMDFADDFTRDPLEGDVFFHFVITGEPGRAYPPLMAVNSQHTIRLIPAENGGWKIAMHYFPGATRKFYRTGLLSFRTDEEVLDELMEEFSYTDVSDVMSGAPEGFVSSGGQAYNPDFAAMYAKAFTEGDNPDFYRVNEWLGNCMNFISQSILHGFGSGQIPESGLNRFMTKDWFSGGGGGSPEWENVGRFWQYVIGENPLRCQILNNASSLKAGDIILTRTYLAHSADDPERFTHALMVVDTDTLKLGQNTPASFVYYSDLVYSLKRYVRPIEVRG
jgi:hypothetical protein